MSNATPEPTTHDEAQRIQNFLKQGGQVALNEVETIKAQAGVQATIDKPGVISYPTTLDHLNTATLAALTRRTTIELEFEGVSPSDRVSAAVFINNSAASRQTSFEHPSFAGAVSFFMHPMAPDNSMVMAETLLYELDITNVVKRLGRAAGPVTASVVVQPLHPTSLPSALTIRSSTLRVLDSTVKRSA